MRRDVVARLIFTTLAVLAAAACSSPYALRVTDINYKSEQHAGPIQYSDPRLFRREVLINERNDERDYLGQLLKDSVTIPFSPEIIRDLETISSFAANLGIRFDPAAGQNFRRQEETSGIQQEIATLRLQMELEQLKRDVELFRTNLANQTAPSQTLGAGTTTSAATLSSGVTPPDTSQITSQITSLQAALAARLDQAHAALQPGGGGASPIDTFYDRSAYRALLTRARNAASLDELHDSQGSALIRLAFSATVLPPPREYANSLGVLRMEIVPPEWTDDEKESVYRLWLLYVTREMNRPGPHGTFTTDLTLQGLVGGEFFELAYYYYPLAAGTSCRGLSFDAAPQDGCGVLRIALAHPVIAGGAVLGSLQSFYGNVTARGATLQSELIGARSALVDDPARVDCAGGQMLNIAVGIDFLMRQAAEADLQARAIIAGAGGVAAPTSQILAELDRYAPAAGGLIGTFRTQAAARGCPALPARPRLYVPPPFAAALTDNPQRVAVYDLTPREQAQRVSSSARAANAISLAAAVAAQAPSAGLGANAGIGYSRSATGRADALERVPLVVSFAEAGDGHTPNGTAFGWLLGPRVTLDAGRNELTLSQRLTPYDLSVDLTVPGWWPYLTLRTETAWAPNWREGNGRTVAPAGALPRSTRVPLGTNSADLAAFTARLTGNSLVRIASIRDFVPGRISACAGATELQIRGANIWRADTVIIGGRRFQSDQVRVLPDMNGLSVTIPKAAFAAYSGTTPDTHTVHVTVLTPYGPAELDLPVDQLDPADGGCIQDQPAASDTGPAIASVDRTSISLCLSRPTFVVTGRNLGAVISAKLGDESGTWQAGSNGTSGTASFPNLVTRDAFAGIATTELVLGTARPGQEISREISIVQATCS